MKRLLLAMALCLTVAAENITVQWNPNPESDVAGYLVHWSKNPASTNLTHYAQAGSSWQGQWTNVGRLSTNMTITIAGTNLIGTNFFRLTAYSTSALSSELSNTAWIRKLSTPTGAGATASVEIQSTTNLMVWITEDILPFNFTNEGDRKFWRAKMDVKQGNPALFLTIPTPPAP